MTGQSDSPYNIKLHKRTLQAIRKTKEASGSHENEDTKLTQISFLFSWRLSLVKLIIGKSCSPASMHNTRTHTHISHFVVRGVVLTCCHVFRTNNSYPVLRIRVFKTKTCSIIMWHRRGNQPIP